MALSDATVEDWGITKEDYLPCPVDVQDGFLLISFVPCNLTLAQGDNNRSINAEESLSRQGLEVSSTPGRLS